MDRERKKRIQTIKLIITEILMVVTVVAAVVILTFVAMGYNVNKDGDLAQSGLLQVKSFPTGATVTIDDEVMFARTNMSRMLPAGAHTVELTKDGYDTWRKDITTESGWLLKLDYPRLFLQERTMEKVREHEDNIQKISYSPNGGQILYKLEQEEEWRLLNIVGDEVTEAKLDFPKYLGENALREMVWDKNGDKVLIRTKNGDKNEWVLLNLRNVDGSVNVSKEFGLEISKIDFLTDSGDRLLVLENGNLRMIPIGEKTVSQVLAKDVFDFARSGDNIVYSAVVTPTAEMLQVVGEDTAAEKSDCATESKTMRALMLYVDNANDVFVKKLENDTAVKFALASYLGKDYLVVAEDAKLAVYRGNLSRGNEGLSEMEQVIDVELKFSPSELEVWAEGELTMLNSGTEIAMFDAELAKLSEYTVESDVTFFPDKYLLGTVSDGKLIVRDFDGENRRELSKVENTGGVFSKNHKWLYYTLVVDGKTNIFREKVVE